MADWSKCATKIYSHGSSKPHLDLRLLLHGVKTPLPCSIIQLKTKHNIEVVLFDPSIENTWLQKYKSVCLGKIFADSPNEPKEITLDLPVENDDKACTSEQLQVNI